LLNELKEYNPALLDKERMIAISKMDLVTEDEDLARIKTQIPENLPFVMISSVMQQGLMELKDMIWGSLQKLKNHSYSQKKRMRRRYKRITIKI
jgi:GTP-binding protein